MKTHALMVSEHGHLKWASHNWQATFSSNRPPHSPMLEDTDRHQHNHHLSDETSLLCINISTSIHTAPLINAGPFLLVSVTRRKYLQFCSCSTKAWWYFPMKFADLNLNLTPIMLNFLNKVMTRAPWHTCWTLNTIADISSDTCCGQIIVALCTSRAAPSCYMAL